MPTYEYLCSVCGVKFERRQAITEPAFKACPECGGSVRRIVSGGAGFIIKGAPGGRADRTCSLERMGTTCCGRVERCGKPPCGGKS